MTDLAQWIELRAWVEASEPRLSSELRLVVEATIPEGGHIEAHKPPEPFLIPTVLEVTAGPGVRAGDVRYPPAEARRLEWSPATLQVLRGTVRFEAPLEVQAVAGGGPRLVSAALSYQGCVGGACLPPNTQSVELEVSPPA